MDRLLPQLIFFCFFPIDKLWQGVLHKPSEDVFQFVLKLISQAKRRSGGGGALSLEGIYKSLNRYALLPISEFVLDENFQQNAIMFLYIYENQNLLFPFRATLFFPQ